MILTLPVLAHKVTGSLWADGTVIEGEILFSNGDYAAAGTIVEVTDENGTSLGKTEIDDEGLFRFQPQSKINHYFTANLGAGHVANLVMRAEDIPLEGEVMEVTSTPSASNIAPNGDNAALKDMIREAVRQEVQPLRRELAAYKEKNDLQSILGGIGFIIGLCGVAFYMMARKKKITDGS